MAELYSVRMRAAQGGPHEKGGHHISGAERIVKLEEVGAIAQSLADRALYHSKGTCLLYTSPSPRDLSTSRMPSSA